jgi:hypothetical protein
VPAEVRRINDLITAYKISPEFTNRAVATRDDYTRYLKIIGEAWGPLLVSGVRPKNVLKLRDAWAATPVAANHLLSVARTLINWGIPREFSETNPCQAIPKLETEEGGARPWPVWAYGLIETHARDDLRRAVWLARYTGQRQADVIRMGKADLEDGGIKVTSRRPARNSGFRCTRTSRPKWRPGGSGRRGCSCRRPRATVTTPSGSGRPTRLMNDTPAGRIRREGFTFPWPSGLERREFARGWLRRRHDRVDHRHVAGHHQAVQPLGRSEETCEGGDPAARTNKPRTLIGKLTDSWKTHLLDLYKEKVGDRLTVGQRTLTPPVLVRIQVPQPPGSRRRDPLSPRSSSLNSMRAVHYLRNVHGPQDP